MSRFYEKWDKILKILSLLTTFLLNQNGRYIVIINTEENIDIFLLLCAHLQQIMTIMEMFILRMSRIASLLTAFMKVRVRKGKNVKCFSYMTDNLFTSWDFKIRHFHITGRKLKSEFKWRFKTEEIAWQCQPCNSSIFTLNSPCICAKIKFNEGKWCRGHWFLYTRIELE
jgi:hypothetical protein